MRSLVLNSVVGSLHRLIGKTHAGTWLARKVRNQAMAIVRCSLNDGIDLRSNGELLVINAIAPSARFFVDVGANTGNWTRAFLSGSNDGVRGLLFEPSPDALTALRANMGEPIEGGQITISSAAVSDEVGSKEFFVEAACGETSSLIGLHSRSDARKVVVDVTTIDNEVERHGLSFIDILKIDAEGYDLRVIKGARRCLEKACINVVQFEYNQPWAYAGSTLFEALGILDNCGYSTYLLRSDGLHRFDYSLDGEYFGYSNFVALSPRFAGDLGRYVVA